MIVDCRLYLLAEELYKKTEFLKNTIFLKSLKHLNLGPLELHNIY